MSYHMSKVKGLRNEQGRSSKSLASLMGSQGDQPKVSQNPREYVGKVMGQPASKSGSKGSACKSLGSVMGQGGGKNG
jgi:hypothetical protein